MKRLNLKDVKTIGEIKSFLMDIPDDTEISINNIGNTGLVKEIILEYFHWDIDDNEFSFYIKAEKL